MFSLSTYVTAASKLAGVLYTVELQRRLDAENVPIICISASPGAVATGDHEFRMSIWFSDANFTIYSEGNEASFRALRFGPVLIKLMKLLAKPAAEGAHNPVFAAASPKVRAQPEKYKGCVLEHVGKLSAPAPGGRTKQSRSLELADELWATTEKLLAEADITTAS